MTIVQLNTDVLELIFKFLDFRSLCGKLHNFSNHFHPLYYARVHTEVYYFVLVLKTLEIYTTFFSAAEMTCKLWKEVVNERRLYWQLSKHLCAQRVPKFLNNHSDSKNSSNGRGKKRKWDCPHERRRLLRFAPVKKYGNKIQRNPT